MDIHTLLMLLAAIAVIWLICAPCKQVQDDELKQDQKAPEASATEQVASTHDLSIPL